MVSVRCSDARSGTSSGARSFHAQLKWGGGAVVATGGSGGRVKMAAVIVAVVVSTLTYNGIALAV